MDPLSISASIAGVATAAFQIIGYLSSVASGGKDRLSLLNEITHLWLTITALQTQLADTQGQDAIPQELQSLFAVDNGIIKEIEDLVNELNTKLKSRSGYGKIKQTLIWPLTEADVLKVVEKIHRMQQTIQFALSQINHSMTRDILQTTLAVKDIVDETQLKEMIDWLSSLNFIAKQQLLFREHHEGTCKWFLDHEDFREWIEHENGVLLCPGIPGAGKTFLSSIVIDELDNMRRSNTEPVKDAAILMLYCKWDDAQSQWIDSLLGSLLKQIAQRYGVKSKDTLKMFKKHSGARTKPSREELITVLCQELKNFPRSFIVIDGLDELREEDKRLTLIEILTSLEAKVNLMITSRPLENIVRHFVHVDRGIYCDQCNARDLPYQYHCYECDDSNYDICQKCIDDGKQCSGQAHSLIKQFTSFRIEVAAVEEDLLTYVEWRITTSAFLQKCIALKEGLREKIISTVVNENDGMFLLAKFNMDTLTSKLRPGDVIAALEVLPNELDGTFTDAMGRISDLSSNHREVAMDFLRWVVFAEEPLHVGAIEHAIAVTEMDEDINQDFIIQAPVLASMCAGLVQFDESDCVRLVHYSAQDFFRRNWQQYFPEGRDKLVSVCLTYLLFDPFKNGACSGPTELTDFDERVEKYPLLGYAAKNWGKLISQTSRDDLWERARRLLHDQGCFASLTQALWYLDDEDHSSWAGKDGSSALHLASHLGLTKLVAEFVKEGVNPDVKDANGVTPLMLAADHGNVDVAKVLIEAGASVSSVDNTGRSLLYKATELNEVAFVELLIKQKGIDVNITHPRQSDLTPLILAAMNGCAEIVQLLVSVPQLEINKSCSDPPGATALVHAASAGMIDCVKILLEQPGIDIDLQDERGSTALLYASKNGYTDVVEALLERNADTEALQYGTEGTALMRAIDWNAIPVVELLLKKGANVHARDCFGRGTLHSAACNGRSEIIKILLEFDPTLDVNMQDVNGKTTLHDAARLGLDDTARVLLDYGADPTIKDKFGRTPIRVAREMNENGILQMLRSARRQREEEMKVSEDVLDLSSPKRTDTGTIIQPPHRTNTEVSVDSEPLALWALASANLTDEVTERLSEELDEDINGKDPDIGETALHYAVTNNNEEMTRQLISRGADVNVTNNYGRTPLHLAALYANYEAGEILLDAGANINALDQWGATALEICRAGSQRSLSILLIEHGAKLTDDTLTLNAFLELAVIHGSAEAVSRLVAAGAELWKKDWYGRTPFMIARSYEREDIAALLLELGKTIAVSNASLKSASTDDSSLTDMTGDTDQTSLMDAEDDSVKSEFKANEDSPTSEQTEAAEPISSEVKIGEVVPEVVPAALTTNSKGVSLQTYIPTIASAVFVLVVAFFVALMRRHQDI
ncbi:ankyrin, putative [Talaromyces stipitatus ATCC 10500]|uniref:Ankyrin, putative n=1 Tax=Talaromyces stipitatus (strain ATCC 10500 / CBS 375.48 / QM 6759 / NRRL 1006) TaxID=441959 RepID=B8MMQ7_TALSN|nr:ankyrin, putative [Talaromyces stipitatus ATCC 10500]EED13813.1 ankyrin, putative [Talaromyces stipitatus ATCC 10500]